MTTIDKLAVPRVYDPCTIYLRHREIPSDVYHIKTSELDVNWNAEAYDTDFFSVLVTMSEDEWMRELKRWFIVARAKLVRHLENIALHAYATGRTMLVAVGEQDHKAREKWMLNELQTQFGNAVFNEQLHSATIQLIDSYGIPKHYPAFKVHYQVAKNDPMSTFALCDDADGLRPAFGGHLRIIARP